MEPKILSLAMGGNDGFAQERGLEVGGGDRVDDLGVVGNDGFLYLLAKTVLLHCPPRRLHFRKLRHFCLACAAIDFLLFPRFFGGSGSGNVCCFVCFNFIKLLFNIEQLNDTTQSLALNN